MKTYTSILNKINATVKELAEEVEKLENNFRDTEDITKYLIAYNEHKEVRELYHNFFAYCVRNNFNLDSTYKN